MSRDSLDKALREALHKDFPDITDEQVENIVQIAHGEAKKIAAAAQAKEETPDSTEKGSA